VLLERLYHLIRYCVTSQQRHSLASAILRFNLCCVKACISGYIESATWFAIFAEFIKVTIDLKMAEVNHFQSVAVLITEGAK